MTHSLWALGALVAAIGLGTSARAELGASVSLSSDVRYRGYSISDDRGALSVSLSYDHSSGAYAELTTIAAPTAHDGVKVLGYQAYAGYAVRTRSGTNWEVGFTHSDLTEFLDPRDRLTYSEVYAGVSAHNLSAHVYYSPNYLGEGSSTVYVDANWSMRPAPDWKLFVHGGVLQPVKSDAGAPFSRTQYDFRAGAARRFKAVELQVAWSIFSPNADYPPGHRQKSSALVLGATYNF